MLIYATTIADTDIEMVNVYNPEENDNLGDHEEYHVNIGIFGRLKLNEKVFSIIKKYEFTSTPREGYIFKNMIAYDNSTVNLDKVLNNLVNSFSYECYKVVNNLTYSND
ncbi:hypothetical protein [Yeosuana marina]|uniref:hypothetical protein n=1 Tax=Yeosuana marina TaxID=1565536 RepID=UPI00142009D3|nr:hypothetical protein [Yeosuana marina]